MESLRREFLTIWRDILKTFDGEFNKFKKMLEDRTNFALARFSDGEMFILQNKTVILAENHFQTGDIVGRNRYTKEEQKEFIPEKHQYLREELLDSFKHRQKNYFKGLSCRSDVGEENFQWQLNLLGEHTEDELTFANLLINKNYSRFIEEIVPIFSERKIVYVVNELANTQRLPFAIEKEFRIGSNCMVNDHDVIEEVNDYLKNSEGEHIVLCSGASLSNLIIHNCFKDNPNNTFLDLGSTLNPYLELEGWKYTRGYLTSYWMGSGSPYGERIDTW